MAAEALDHGYRLEDTLRSACHFARKSAEQRTAFEQACLTRAETKAASLLPQAVVRLRPALPNTLFACAVLVGLSTASEILAHNSVPQEARPTATRSTQPKNTESPSTWPGRIRTASELRRIASIMKGSASATQELEADIEELAQTVKTTHRGEADVLTALRDLELRARTLSGLDAAAWNKLVDALAAQRWTAPLSAALRSDQLANLQGAAQDLRAQLPVKIDKERTKLLQQLARLQGALQPAEREQSKRLLRQSQAEDRAQKPHVSQAQEEPLEQLRKQLERAKAALEARDAEAAQKALNETIGELESLARMQRDRERAEKAARELAQLRQELLRGPQPPTHKAQPDKKARHPLADEARAQATPGQSAAHMPGGAPGGVALRPQDERGGERSAEPSTPLLSPEVTETQAPASGAATRVHGQAGAGPSRRQVIATATSSGFATVGYERVHAEYVEYEERAMEQAPLSESDRFAIERYFQLIRPTQGSP